MNISFLEKLTNLLKNAGDKYFKFNDKCDDIKKRKKNTITEKKTSKDNQIKCKKARQIIKRGK